MGLASFSSWKDQHHRIFPESFKHRETLKVADVASSVDRYEHTTLPATNNTPVAPNILHWHWNGQPPPLQEMLAVLDVAVQNPDYEKYLFTENKHAILKSIKHLFHDAGVSDTITQHHKDHWEDFLQDKYGITFKEPKELFKEKLQEPIFSLDWALRDDQNITEKSLDKRMEDAQQKISLLHMQEGLGISANFAGKGNLLRLLFLYKLGGSYFDTDVSMKDQNSSLPLDRKIPNGILFSDYAVSDTKKPAHEKFTDAEWKITHPGAYLDPTGDSHKTEVRDFANNIMHAPKGSPAVLHLILNMVENPDAYPLILNDSYNHYKDGFPLQHGTATSGQYKEAPEWYGILDGNRDGESRRPRGLSSNGTTSIIRCLQRSIPGFAEVGGPRKLGMVTASCKDLRHPWAEMDGWGRAFWEIPDKKIFMSTVDNPIGIAENPAGIVQSLVPFDPRSKVRVQNGR